MTWFVDILARALALAVAIVGTSALAQDYPTRPVTIVVGYTPGATSDLLARTVHVDLPVNSVAELIAYAKANPGQLQYGSSGIGSPHHLAGELLRQKTGINVVHVPYR